MGTTNTCHLLAKAKKFFACSKLFSLLYSDFFLQIYFSSLIRTQLLYHITAKEIFYYLLLSIFFLLLIIFIIFYYLSLYIIF